MGLLPVEDLLAKLQKDRVEGRLDEEAVVKVIAVVEVAEAEVVIESVFLQGAVLLSYLL